MNQKIKISQLPAKGSNLAAQDLIEIAEFTGTGYISKSITGQEIIDAAVGNVDWGDIGGTLSAQTDLQNALDAKVPTSRTLTINGVTQDLSANRTFTISTGITIGTTAIASGTVGRILFQGAANTVQQNGNLFWDNTNSRLGLGTTSPSNTLHLASSASNTRINISNSNATPNTGLSFLSGSTSSWSIAAYGTNMNFTFYNDFLNADALFITRATNNIGINTTTDAGFKLDVNGTARVQNSATTATAFTATNTLAGGIAATFSTANGGSVQFTNGYIESNSLQFRISTNGTQPFVLMTQGTERMRLAPTTGNVLINTTTDAGFRLDVNGTARVNGVFSVGADTARIDLWRSSGAFGGRIGTGYSNPAVNHVYIQCDTNSKAILIDDSNRTLFSSSNGDTTTASAQVTINSTTRGFLPPRMTTTQKNAIASPAAGLMVYDTTLNVISYYNGSMWI